MKELYYENLNLETTSSPLSLLWLSRLFVCLFVVTSWLPWGEKLSLPSPSGVMLLPCSQVMLKALKPGAQIHLLTLSCFHIQFVTVKKSWLIQHAMAFHYSSSELSLILLPHWWTLTIFHPFKKSTLLSKVLDGKSAGCLLATLNPLEKPQSFFSVFWEMSESLSCPVYLNSCTSLGDCTKYKHQLHRLTMRPVVCAT